LIFFFPTPEITQPVEIIQTLDGISEEICFLDCIELCRSVHPDIIFRETAEKVIILPFFPNILTLHREGFPFSSLIFSKEYFVWD
jgi:hypothetical protein